MFEPTHCLSAEERAQLHLWFHHSFIMLLPWTIPCSRSLFQISHPIVCHIKSHIRHLFLFFISLLDSLDPQTNHLRSNYNILINHSYEEWKRRPPLQNRHSVTLLNVRSISQRNQNQQNQTHSKIFLLNQLVQELNPSALILTETNILIDDQHSKMLLQNTIPSHSFFHCHNSTDHPGRGGVSIGLIDNWFKYSKKVDNYRGRVLIVDSNFPSPSRDPPVTKIRWIGVYCPANKNESEDTAIGNFIKRHIDDAYRFNREIIMAGDFNGLIDPSKDKFPPTPQTTPNTRTLKTIQESALVDIYRTFHQTDGYTFGNLCFEPTEPSTTRSKSRIDYVFTTDDTFTRIDEIVAFNPNVYGNDPHRALLDHNGIMFSILSPNDDFIQTTSEPLTTTQIVIDFKQCTKTHWDDYHIKLLNNEALFVQMTGPLNSCRNENEALIALEDCFISLTKELTKAAHTTLPTKTVGGKHHRFTPHEIRDGHYLIQYIKRMQKNVIDLVGQPDVHITEVNDKLAAHKYFMHMEHPIFKPFNTHQNMNHWKNRTNKIITDLINTIERKSLNSAEKITEAIQKREDLWQHNPGIVIKTLLGRNKQRVSINKWVDKDPQTGEINGVYDNPEIVKENILKQFEHIHRKRTTDIPSLLDDPEWKSIYDPEQQDHIDPNIYSDLMTPPSLKEIHDIISEWPNKAPGPTQMTSQMLKHAPRCVRVLIHKMFTLIFEFQVMPPTMTKGQIYPIPKGDVTWDTDVTNTRPITLLEILSKMCLKIVTQRLTNVLQKHSILKGHNFSVFPGKSTNDVIYTLHYMMEYATQQKEELWVLFQDMKKAFDSVDPAALMLSLKRLRIPSEYIKLHQNIYDTRSTCIITDLGLTEYYKPQSGVPQGGVECPLHWLLFYDPLLTFLQKKHTGFLMKATLKHPLPSLTITSECNTPALAYVDDLTYVAGYKSEMEKITSDALFWLKCIGLEVNAKKTKLIVLNEAESTKSIDFTFDGSQIQRQLPGQGERLLGVHLSSDMKFNTQKELILQSVKDFVNQLENKSITDQMASYLINRVLIPSILYRNKLGALSDKNIKHIDSQLRTLMAHKAGHSKQITRSVLYHPRIYGLYSLREKIIEESITTYQKIINDDGLLGQSATIINIVIANDLKLPSFLHEQPNVKSRGKSLNEKIASFMNERGISFKPPVKPYDEINPTRLMPITAAVTDTETLNILRQKMGKLHIQFLDQILTRNGKETMSWTDMKFLYPSEIRKNIAPKWFSYLVAATTESFDDAASVKRYSLKPDLYPHWETNSFPSIDTNQTEHNEIATVRRSTRTRTQELSVDETAIRIAQGTATSHERNTHYKMDKLSKLNLRRPTRPEIDQIPLTEADLQFLDSIPIDHEIIIFSDGSAKAVGTPEATSGCGVLIVDKQTWNTTISPISLSKTQLLAEINSIPHIEKSAIIKGRCISYIAELAGVYLALTLVKDKPHIPITIVLDNQSVVNSFPREMEFQNGKRSQAQNSNGWHYWEAIRTLAHARQQLPTLKWTRGHIGHSGNTYADYLADRFIQEPGFNGITLNTPQSTEDLPLSRTAPYFENDPIEHNMRSYLNSQSTSLIANALCNHSYLQDKYPKSSSGNVFGENADISILLSTLGGGCKPSSMFTTRAISANRTFHTKQLLGLKPTMEIMHQRYPHIYEDGLCRRCTPMNLDQNSSNNTDQPSLIETQDHVWECSAATSHIETALSIFISELATALLSTISSQQRKQECSLTVRQLCTGLLGLADMEDISEFEHMVTQTLTPIGISTESITSLLNDLKDISYIHLFAGYTTIQQQTFLKYILQWIHTNYSNRLIVSQTTFEKLFSNIIHTYKQSIFKLTEAAVAIWKERCNDTISWEQMKGITPKMKRPPTTASDALQRLALRPSSGNRQLSTTNRPVQLRQTLRKHHLMSQHRLQANALQNATVRLQLTKSRRTLDEEEDRIIRRLPTSNNTDQRLTISDISNDTYHSSPNVAPSTNTYFQIDPG
jgi:ribonuclease HI